MQSSRTFPVHQLFLITDPTAAGRSVTDEHHLRVTRTNSEKEERLGCSPEEKDKDLLRTSSQLKSRWPIRDGHVGRAFR